MTGDVFSAKLPRDTRAAASQLRYIIKSYIKSQENQARINNFLIEKLDWQSIYRFPMIDQCWESLLDAFHPFLSRPFIEQGSVHRKPTLLCSNQLFIVATASCYEINIPSA